MTTYVLRDKLTGKFLQKTNAWSHTLTSDIQLARVYTSKGAATRTMQNTPAYSTNETPDFEMKEITIILVD